MSKIEWTEQTWNPIVGCSIVSPSCTNCYAMKMADRLQMMSATQFPHYQGTTKRVNGKPVWTGKLAPAPEATLLAPLRRKKPTMYFVNSMSDLFHEDVPDAWIDRVFAVMAASMTTIETGYRGHTFQVLTKRSTRMRAYLSNPDREQIIDEAIDALAKEKPYRFEAPNRWPRSPFYGGVDNWPLPNVWLGVSAERQQEADARIPDLLATPAAVRFVSAEPLLGPIYFTVIEPDADTSINAHTGQISHWRDDYCEPGAKLDWIIAGGESGPNARPMHPDWARSIRDTCTQFGTAFFFKQWGAFAPASMLLPGDHLQEDADTMLSTSKASAGRLLDGREWNEYPDRQSDGSPTADCPLPIAPPAEQLA